MRENRQLMFKIIPHSPYKVKGISWMICSGCGLVYLGNNLTRWCIKQGCDHSEHPQYDSMLKRCDNV